MRFRTTTMVDGNVPDVENVKAFLEDLSAVTPMGFQIWDLRANLVFSTQPAEIDASIRALHRRVIKKIFKAEVYAHDSTENGHFICGLPFCLHDGERGILVAYGSIPAAAANGDHPGRMKRLLQQTLLRGPNATPPRQSTKTVLPEQAEQRIEDLTLFANISKQFRSLRLKQPVLDRLMQRILGSVAADAAFLHLPNHPDYNQLTIRPGLEGSSSSGGSVEEQLRQIITAGLDTGSGNYCSVENSLEDERLASLSDRPFRMMAVTVRHLKETYGWLGLISYAVESGFRDDALNIAQTLANQLAVMMANMEQYDDLERFTVNIVCSLVNAIEAKDAFFRGHSKRVNQYVMQMASHLQLPAEEREALKWAAVLHDIGKIGIPEKILCKPGKLTPKEFDLIKQHPQKGQAILAPIRQLQPSMEAIAHHHENYDGSGYPEGLTGGAIPLAARMIAVADTFDAITSKRSYHHPKTPEKAIRLLDKLAGTQLDPQLVLVFKTVCQELINTAPPSATPDSALA
jgi:putative nucleotidyltransferase with HDIG domain